MSRKVRFNDELEEKTFDGRAAPLVRAKQSDGDFVYGGDMSFPKWVSAIVAVFLIAFLVIWIMGLVRMGRCGGRKCWLWWCTIFIPLFVPGVGQLWGLIVGILALVMLRNGGKLLTMQCPQ